MSFCSFIMIISSAMRMIIYIQYYYLTFLRILVLWALLLLFCLFIGVVAEIFVKKFDLFKYSVVTVTVLYIALSFAHPDYMIAAFDLKYVASEDGTWDRGNFIKSSVPYQDYMYLSNLSADAAPVLISYVRDNDGADMADLKKSVQARKQALTDSGFSVRKFNVSRYIALRQS